MRGNNNTVELEDVEVGEDSASGNAIRIRVGDKDWEWCPLSQVSEITRSKDHKNDSIVVAQWLAKERGWI